MRKTAGSARSRLERARDKSGELVAGGMQLPIQTGANPHCCMGARRHTPEYGGVVRNDYMKACLHGSPYD